MSETKSWLEDEEYSGCSRICWKRGKHTLVYGQCEFGEIPKPTLDFFVVETADDGYPMGVTICIQASVFIPWLDQLPTNEQFALLERVARAKPERRSVILESEKNAWTS